MYAIYYYYEHVDTSDTAVAIVYFGQTLMILIILWLLAGTMGFLGAYTFVHSIYRSVKRD